MSSTNSNRSRRVGYARVSEDDQTSIPEQIEWIKAICERDRAELVRVFVDHGIPGSEIDGRPELQALIDFVAAEFKGDRTIDSLVVWDLDRFSRADSLDTNRCLADIRQDGVGRVCTNGDGWIDLHSDIDRVMMNLRQDLQRSAFSPKLSRDVLRSMAKMAREGIWMGGIPPRGYRVEKQDGAKSGRLVLGTQEDVNLIRWLFRTYAEENCSLADLAKRLQKRGVPTRREKGRWNRQTVHRILSNRVYAGDFVWNATHQGKFSRLAGDKVEKDTESVAREHHKRRHGLKRLPTNYTASDNVIIVPNNHVAIIDRELFDAVQRKLAANKTECSPGQKRDWALSGLLRCGHCGDTMRCFGATFVRKTKGGIRTYNTRYIRCSKRLDEGAGSCDNGATPKHDDVLREVVWLLQDQLGNPAAVGALRHVIEGEADRRASEVRERKEEVNRQIQSAEVKVSSAARRLFELPEDVLAEATAALRSVKEERERLVDELASLERSESDISPRESERVRRALEKVGELDRLLDLADQSEIREALRGLVTEIRVFCRQVESARKRRTGEGRMMFQVSRVELSLFPSLAELFASVFPQRP
jgi:site-specific DNA recombinase